MQNGGCHEHRHGHRWRSGPSSRWRPAWARITGGQLQRWWLNAPSASACGSEQMIVSVKANLGLPSGKKCFSKRAFAIHPHFPKGAKIVSYQEFINASWPSKASSQKCDDVSLIACRRARTKSSS